MAKYERRLSGDFDEIVRKIEDGILGESVSATFEDGTYFRGFGARCSVRIYERYSAFGGNRVSLTVTVFESGDEITVSGITSGGSQAVFMKINTLGEETFLESFRRTVDKL